MTSYTVANQSDGSGPAAQSTQDLDEAIDWYTNAVEAVMDQESDVTYAAISVDGVIWGEIRENGLAPQGGGEVIDLKPRRARTKAA